MIVLAAASTGASAARTATDAKEELRDLRGRIEALQKRLAGAEESHAEAADALKDSERAISDANRMLRELARRSQDVNRKLSELDREARRTRTTIEAQQTQLARLLYRQYVGGRADPLRILLSGEDPNRIARHLHYLAHVSRARAALIGDIDRQLNGIAQVAREAEREARELAAITTEQRAQRERLESEKRTRARLLAAISRDVRRQRTEIGTLKRNETRLARLVEQLGRIVARPRSRAAPPRTRNDQGPERSIDARPFERLKGRLALPVRGELGNRFGSPRTDGGPAWKGLFILARAGEEVRAIADGRVVFADWLRGFGNLMIVDHGGAFMSLYGNNEALYKRVGDTVRGGDAIAAVGNSGGNADSGLYFELRHEGKPLDPLSWVEVR
jgi:septal ring factor EnvC (AmiA/AmiB activator)